MQVPENVLQAKLKQAQDAGIFNEAEVIVIAGLIEYHQGSIESYLNDNYLEVFSSLMEAPNA